MLGAGVRLFEVEAGGDPPEDSLASRPQLKLLAEQAYENGVLLLDYALSFEATADAATAA